MNDKQTYRLSPHTGAEALINSWVAWPHVMSPMPHALHLANYQMKTLDSYLRSPAIHYQSSQNPKLLGGPFVAIPPERADEVAAHAESLRRDNQELLELGRSFVEFQNRLVAEAQGQGLEPFYAQVPEPLKGYVELVYDYHGRPLVRALESLLYASPYYRDGQQSLQLFAQEHDLERPYYMSTPRLPREGRIDWRVPFASPVLDDFFKLDSEGQPLGAIREMLGLAPQDDEFLLPLLTGKPAPARPAWTGPGARVRYLGHASVLVEWNGVAILTDPFIPLRPRAGGIPRLSFEDLPAHIDFVLITHGHHDHFVFESLLRLRHRIGCLVMPRCSGIFYGDISIKLMAERLGFERVVEVDILDSLAFPGGEIVAAPFFGEHSDLPHAKSAYAVRLDREFLLFAADSNCMEQRLYEHFVQATGPIKTVFLGMEWIGAPLSWVYGPLLPVKPEHAHSQSRRSNGSNAPAALNLLDAVGAERVFVYAIGREPWLRYFLALVPEDGDPYIVESDRVLNAARERGFRAAERPYGHFDLHLEV